MVNDNPKYTLVHTLQTKKPASHELYKNKNSSSLE